MKIIYNIVLGVFIGVTAGMLGFVPFSAAWWMFFLFCFVLNIAGYIEGKFD